MAKQDVIAALEEKQKEVREGLARVGEKMRELEMLEVQLNTELQTYQSAIEVVENESRITRE